jgi:hypothetical protein
MSMRMVRPSIAILLLFVVTPLVTAADEPTILVRDEQGNLVGVVLAQTKGLALTQGLTDTAPLWVAKRVSDRWIFLQVTKDAVRGTKGLTPFLYENDLCAGPPLLDAPAGDTVRPTVVFDTQVYWSVDPGSPRVIRSRGVLVHDADLDKCDGTLLDGNLCCTVPGKEETRLAAETVSVPLAHLDLKPPFSLELAPARTPIR